ncbi:AsnC family transcriptional regulator [Nonomuraea sp. NPDC050783]|uniref:Lrp/AsnC family transcriptional regulator n=1 Tax=Nonomuraea sp. NPDC050783 TaxID=3154634 RepID=UPI0034673A57
MANSGMLDGLDRAVVHALQLDGRAPFSRIAGVLGVSEHTVARRYRAMRSRGLLRVVGVPDGGRLGHTAWSVRLTCAPDAAGPVAEALARREDTAWVRLLSGGTEIACGIRAENGPDGPDGADGANGTGGARGGTGSGTGGEAGAATWDRGGGEALLLRRLPRTPRVLSMSAHATLHLFAGWRSRVSALSPEQESQLCPPAGLSAGPAAGPSTGPSAGRAERASRPYPPPATPHGEAVPGEAVPGEAVPREAVPREAVVLGEQDRALLRVLARDGRAGHAELAAACGWSPSTVRRRLEWLRGGGLLAFDVEVPPRALGYRAEAWLWLKVRPARLAAVGAALAAHEEVDVAAAVTGPANLMAAVTCRDTGDLYRYLSERVAPLKGVRELESAPVMRTLKRSGPLIPPAPAPGRPGRRA